MKNCHFYLVRAIGPQGTCKLCASISQLILGGLWHFSLCLEHGDVAENITLAEKREKNEMLSQKYSDDKYSLSPRQRKNRDRGEKNTFTFIFTFVLPWEADCIIQQPTCTNQAYNHFTIARLRWMSPIQPMSPRLPCQHLGLLHFFSLLLEKLHFHFMSHSLMSCNDKSRKASYQSHGFTGKRSRIGWMFSPRADDRFSIALQGLSILQSAQN